MLKHRSGQLLLEVLFTIAVAGIILGVGSSLIFVGLRSDKVSIEKDAALGLIDETFTALRANAFEKWTCKNYAQDTTSSTCPITSPSIVFYDVTKGSSNLYYPTKDSTSGLSYKWVNHTPGAGVRWGNTDNIRAISALSPKDVWIIAVNAGTVWHYDGETWSNANLTGGTGDPLRDIVAVSSTEVWVVGDHGQVFQWNGSTWTTHSGSSKWGTSDIKAVSAPTSTSVWIVGHDGVVYKYDGVSSWTNYTPGAGARWGITGNSSQLKDVSAIAGEAWLVGNSGQVWKYNGSSWTQYTGSWGSALMKTVSFQSSSDIWIGGASGNVYHTVNGGSNWDSFNLGSNLVVSISAFSSNHVLAVTEDDGLWKYDGTSWTKFDSAVAWGSGATLQNLTDEYSNELWVVGMSGKVWTYKAARWDIKAVSVATDDDVTLDGITYSRNFYVQNVCRDDTSRDITVVSDSSGTATTCASGSPSGDSYDSSTAKVTVTVSWGSESLTSSEYITRWANTTCQQTQWSTDVANDLLRTCPTTDYEAQTNISFISSGISLKLLAPLVGTGSLTSTVFDTTKFGTVGEGPAYNFIYLDGSMGDVGDTIRVQIAASDSAAPSSWIGGATCGAGDYWSWTGASGVFGSSKEIKCPSSFTNKRYFKYKVDLCSKANCAIPGSVGDNGPQLDTVIIGWNP